MSNIGGGEAANANAAANAAAANANANEAAAAQGYNQGEERRQDFNVNPLSQIWNSFMHYGGAKDQIGHLRVKDVQDKINSFLKNFASKAFEKALNANAGALNHILDNKNYNNINLSSEDYKGIAEDASAELNNESNDYKGEFHERLKIAIKNKIKNKIKLQPPNYDCNLIDANIDRDFDEISKEMSDAAYKELKQGFDTYNEKIRENFQSNLWNDPYSWKSLALKLTPLISNPLEFAGALIKLQFTLMKANILKDSEEKSRKDVSNFFTNWDGKNKSNVSELSSDQRGLSYENPLLHLNDKYRPGLGAGKVGSNLQGNSLG